ncbi:MAG: hypothetical protein QG635_614 [Bacteroidota bacterium]|nr:hypothetical protein [Bacteroidota bacterium]
MNSYKDLIESNHNIMLGKPVIKGTRITVELVLKKFSEGCSIPEILEIYPHINYKQIQACLEYASDVIGSEEMLEAV